MDKGPRTGGAFCSGSIIRMEARFLIGNKREPEGDKSICSASQTVKVTVNATANPVHLLLRSLVTLGFAKCTDRALARLMPRNFSVIVVLFAATAASLSLLPDLLLALVAASNPRMKFR